MIMQEHEDELEVRLAEIEHLIKDFRQTFKERTSTAENFITMTEIREFFIFLYYKSRSIVFSTDDPACA